MRLFSFALGVGVRGCTLEIGRTAEGRNACSWKMPLTTAGSQVVHMSCSHLTYPHILSCGDRFSSCVRVRSTAGAWSPVGLQYQLSWGCVCLLEWLQAILNTGFGDQRNLMALWHLAGCLESNGVMQMWICRWERNQVTAEEESTHMRVQTPSAAYRKFLLRYLTNMHRKAATTTRLENNRWLSCFLLSLVLLLLSNHHLGGRVVSSLVLFSSPYSKDTCVAQWLRRAIEMVTHIGLLTWT